MKIVLWDVENIGFVYVKKELDIFHSFDEKMIIHNEDYMPMKENQRNHLVNKRWILKLVKPGKNSADYALIDHIENNIKKFNEFHIITGDKGFASVILLLLKFKKKVFLYLKEDQTENLVATIYKSSSNEEIKNFKFIKLN